MFDIEIQKKGSVEVIDSKLLYKALEVASQHTDWIRRRIENYSFEEGKDYYSIMSDRSDGKAGKKRRDYLLTIDMAKELCMIENNETGRKTRRYFIKAAKQLRKHEAVRIASIEARKELTDIVKDSGENERMHGHAYSNYTNLVYDVCGLREKYKTWKKYDSFTTITFRDFIKPEELKRVKLAESIIKPLLELEKEYSEIKETIKPLFEVKF